VLSAPACVGMLKRHVSISTSHSRRSDLLFREIRHAVFGYEVVAVDWRTMLSASINHTMRVHDPRDILYPPHMRRLPVKADLPCSTRQLSKTVSRV